MPKILGIDIPNNKHTNISLTYLYGIGPSTADKICEMAKQYNMEPDKLKELMQEKDIENLKEEISMNKVIDMLVNKAKISKPRAKKAETAKKED